MRRQPHIESALPRLSEGLLTNGDGLLQQAASLEPGEAIEFERRGIVYWLIRPTRENLDELRAGAMSQARSETLSRDNGDK